MLLARWILGFRCDQTDSLLTGIPHCCNLHCRPEIHVVFPMIDHALQPHACFRKCLSFVKQQCLVWEVKPHLGRKTSVLLKTFHSVKPSLAIFFWYYSTETNASTETVYCIQYIVGRYSGYVTTMILSISIFFWWFSASCSSCMRYNLLFYLQPGFCLCHLYLSDLIVWPSFIKCATGHVMFVRHVTSQECLFHMNELMKTFRNYWSDLISAPIKPDKSPWVCWTESNESTLTLTLHSEHKNVIY